MACTLHAEPSPQPCTGLSLPSPDPEIHLWLVSWFWWATGVAFARFHSSFSSSLSLSLACVLAWVTFSCVVVRLPTVTLTVLSSPLCFSSRPSSRFCMHYPEAEDLDWRVLGRLLNYSYGTYLNILRLKFGKGIQSHGANKETLNNEKFPLSISHCWVTHLSFKDHFLLEPRSHTGV